MIRATLAGVTVGDGLEPGVMGVINVSPESFYGGSVAVGDDRLLTTATRMIEAGASLIDVGAMSTAPYLDAAISPGEEAARLGRAIRLIAGRLGAPVSADTTRAEPARAALDAGARVINDVSGLRADPGLAVAVAQARCVLILAASPRAQGSAARETSGASRAAGALPRPLLGSGFAGEPGTRAAAAVARGIAMVRSAVPSEAGEGFRGPDDVADPVLAVRELLAASLRAAAAAGIDPGAVVVDPGIGFFRRGDMPWHEWDCRVLAALPTLLELGRPICVGVSRKSFIGALTGQDDPSGRLPGSLAATAAAVLGGAHLIRAHDVAETVQAVRVAAAIRRARGEALPLERPACC